MASVQEHKKLLIATSETIVYSLSLAEASMLLISIIIEVKRFTYSPGLRDPALRGNKLALSISHSIRRGRGHQFSL